MYGKGRQYNDYTNPNRRSWYQRNVLSTAQRSINDFCYFCKPNLQSDGDHDRRHCPTFKQLKNATSSNSYIDVTLKERDEQGYAASGIVMWRRKNDDDIEFLLVRESRNEGYLLNCPGGKRLNKDIPSLACAINQVDNEMGRIFSPTRLAQLYQKCPFVLWNVKSKYVVYFHEWIDDVDELRTDSSCYGKKPEWVSRDQIMDPHWRENEVHIFFIDILEFTIASHFIEQLQTLFDYSHHTQDKLLADVCKHFHIMSKLQSALNLADPTIPFEQNSAQLIAISSFIEKEINEIKEQFSLDSLSSILKRDPTNEENKLSFICFQIMSELSKDHSSQLELKLNLKEYYRLYGKTLYNIKDANDANDGHTIAQHKELRNELARLTM